MSKTLSGAAWVTPCRVVALLCATTLLGACHPFEDAGEYPFPDSIFDLSNPDAGGDVADTNSRPDQTSPDAVAQPDSDTDAADTIDTVGPPCLVDTDCCLECACVAGECVVTGCVDVDQDGFGVGPTCEVQDCDDGDPTFYPGTGRRCSDEPEVCVQGFQLCAEEGPTDCVGEIFPRPETCNGVDDDCDGEVDEDTQTLTCLGACSNASVACGSTATCGLTTEEICDGIDNDCDGLLDEGCEALCAFVGGVGGGMSEGTIDNPYASIGDAVAQGAEHICLLNSAACTSTRFELPNTFVMPGGISIEGSYNPESGTQCENPTTILAPTALHGVHFLGVSSGASLSMVKIARNAVAATPTDTVAAITIDAATEITLSRVITQPDTEAEVVIGVDIRNFSQVRIQNSRLDGASGQTAIGVRVTQSSVELLDNSDASRACASAGILGRDDATGGQSKFSYGILLENPRAVVIERTAVCVLQPANKQVGIKLHGGAICPNCPLHIADNVVRVGTIYGTSTGVQVEGCGGRALAIERNEIEVADAAIDAFGVLVNTACGATIAGNAVGVVSTGADSVNGIMTTGGWGTICDISGNHLEVTNSATMASYAVGIACHGPLCNIARNEVAVTAVHGPATGLSVLDTLALVNTNAVEVCAGTQGVGIELVKAGADVHTNQLVGNLCGPSAAGVKVLPGGGWTRQPYVRANSIVGALTADCANGGQSVGVAWGPPSGLARLRVGMLTNNAMHGGTCPSSAGLEVAGLSHPWAVLNNVFWGNGAPVTNQELDTSNKQKDPLWVKLDAVAGAYDFHLTEGSPCLDNGRDEDIPPEDYDREPRPHDSNGDGSVRASIGSLEH